MSSTSGEPPQRVRSDLSGHSSFVSESCPMTSDPFASAADSLVVHSRPEFGLTVRPSNAQGVRGPSLPVSPERAPLGLRGSTEIPYPVLEHIIDAVAVDDRFIDGSTLRRIPLVDAIERQRSERLRALSLVHRSWTTPSQRRLATRIVIKSPPALLRLLQTPLPGHHTKELVVAFGEIWNDNRRFDGIEVSEHPEDVESNLCNLLRRLPRLRSLTVKENGLREDVLLPVVSELGYLESLSWYCAHGYPSCDFVHVAKALGTLRRLSSLEIGGWSFHDVSGVINAHSPHRLKDLCLCISPKDMRLGRIGWLLQALAVDGRNTKLTVDVTLIGTLSMADVFSLFPSVCNTLGRLDNLYIVNKGRFVDFNLAQSRILLQACSSVRQLHIQGQTASVMEFLDILPQTLEELCFSWFDIWVSPWDLIETCLPGLVRSNRMKNLRKIAICNYELDSGGALVSNLCPDTQAACNEHRVELDLRLSKAT